MKKIIIIATIISLILVLGCTKEIEKIIYPNCDLSAKGSIVGLVLQKESNARVVVRQATPIDSAVINPMDGSFRIDSLAVGNYDLYVKAQNYGTHWIRNAVVNPGGVTYTGEILLFRVPDLVESFYPKDKSEELFDRRWSQLSISILFSDAMDRESVEQAFSTDPPSEGMFYWGIYAAAPTDRYFWESASNSYSRSGGTGSGATITTYSKIKAFTYRMARKDCYSDTTYTITISTTAKDTAGKHLGFPLQFCFSTVQSASTLNAIVTNPEHGDIDVDPMKSSSIYMTFPRRMDQASVESELTISPASDVIFVWPSENQLRIYTGGLLMCDTLYQIHLPATVQDLDGVELGEAFDFSFETAPLEVESTTPQSGQIFVSYDTDIRIRFNTYMLLSSVQAAFSIEPAVSGALRRGWRNNSQSKDKDAVCFDPSVNLTPNTKYTVTIGTEAHDLYGTHLKRAYTFAFVTEPE